MTTNTLVYIEINNNKIENVSKEIVSHVSKNFDDTIVCGFVTANTTLSESLFSELRQIGLDKIYIIQHEALKDFNVEVFSGVISQLISNIQPQVLLMGATVNGRELAPRIAANLQIGLTADCTDLYVEDSKLLATRPTYGGQMMATIYSKTLPGFATVRPGAFLKRNFPEKNTEIVYFEANFDGVYEILNKTEILSTEYKPQTDDWTNAEIIIAGGLGLKSKENFEKLYKLCDLIGAKPAASRAAVELGWAPSEIQVGQTGRSVSAKLYIALGISGALQHMTGISNAQKVLAVNTDKNAPIMSCSDVAIVADAAAVIDALTNKFS